MKCDIDVDATELNTQLHKLLNKITNPVSIHKRNSILITLDAGFN